MSVLQSYMANVKPGEQTTEERKFARWALACPQEAMQWQQQQWEAQQRWEAQEQQWQAEQQWQWEATQVQASQWQDTQIDSGSNSILRK